ncbi:F0F1 ATP synthase subunit gamma [Larkinella harenae]
MSTTPEKIQRKIKQATDLGSVVKTMKAITSSKIGEYQKAVEALDAYYETLVLGMHAYLRHHSPAQPVSNGSGPEKQNALLIIFGSDQGLVGPFNNAIADFFRENRPDTSGEDQVWAVGERVQFILEDAGVSVSHTFPIPHSVNAITPLVGQILLKINQVKSENQITEIYSFFNRPKQVEGYEPSLKKLLPFEDEWRKKARELTWPSNRLPQTLGNAETVFSTLFQEYLFTSLYRSCAFSLTSENTSRLNAMHRAEKNIEELSEQLQSDYHQLRQNAIDAELFDVTAGFNSLKKMA